MTPETQVSPIDELIEFRAPIRRERQARTLGASATSAPAGMSRTQVACMVTADWPARGVTPLRARIVYEFRGTERRTPVTGSTGDRARNTCGLDSVIVKGRVGDDEVSTPACVPPRAVTAYCLPALVGAVSVASVYVGDVRPVWAPPVTGEVSVKLIKPHHGRTTLS